MRIKILLKNRRKERKLTLEKLSKKTGISTTQLNDIENNIKKTSLNNAIIISQALEIDIKELYEIIR